MGSCFVSLPGDCHACARNDKEASDCCALYLHFPLCHSERSEESSRQAQFAPLDCHVATVVAPRNDIMVGHPHPIVRSREIPTVTVFPRNDKEEWNIPLANRGVKLRFCAKIVAVATATLTSAHCREPR